MQHRMAFPLVAREGDYVIRFGGDDTVGGSGLPKLPHVHVYRGRRAIAEFWLWPTFSSKVVYTRATKAEISKAEKLALKYYDQALTAWRQHFHDDSPDFSGGTRIAFMVDFTCRRQPKVVAYYQDEFIVVQYCGKAVSLRFDCMSEFARATKEQILNVQAPSYNSPWLHWPDLDADVFLDDLFR
jgi:hypothetical protein